MENGEKKETSLKEMDEKLEHEKSYAENKKEKRLNIGVIIFSIGIIILLLSIFVYLFLTKNQENKKEVTKKHKYYSEYHMNGNSLQNFDLSFLKLEQEEKNKVYSPLSIKYALGMLLEGSNGKSKEQIDAILGDYNIKKYPNNEHMSFANAMFIRNSFKENILADYKNNLTNKFNAEILYDDFKTPELMNNWISSKTLKLIENILSEKDILDKNFFLVNALAIDMNWVNLIQCAKTKSNLPCIHYGVYYSHEKYDAYVSEIDSEESYPIMNFNGRNNIKSVEVGASFNNYDIVKEIGEENIRKTVGEGYREFLANGGCGNDPSVEDFLNQYIREINSNYHREDKSTDFYMYVDDDVKLFAKDLQENDGITLQYVGIMPKNESLESFIQNTNSTKLRHLTEKLQELKYSNFKDGVITKIVGNIPLFKFDYTLDLENDLKKLGVTDIFDIEKSNFSNMLQKDVKQVISASHKANIEFSNEGIKASAVTMLGGGGSTSCMYDYLYDVPVQVIDLTFDKPFMFIIQDKETKEVWFMGSVYDPIKK